MVGQWITQLDSFKFSLGKKFTGISMWSTNESVSPEGHAKLGRVVGFRLEISSGNSRQTLKILSEKSG